MIEIKLPPYTVCRCKEDCSCGVWNSCLDNVKKLNPSGWEVDEEAMAQEICNECLKFHGLEPTPLDQQPKKYQWEMRTLAKAITGTSTKWLKPVNEIK